MRAIKFIQWGSAIATLITIFFLLVVGAVIMFGKTRASMDDLVKLAGILAIFLSPEVLAAFFGNYLKRKQDGKAQENNR